MGFLRLLVLPVQSAGENKGDNNMNITIIDTKNNNIANKSGISSFDLTENNWSCDCNRQRVFGIDGTSRTCIGCKRFLVIDAVVETDDDYECSFMELNEGYPKELVDRYKLSSKCFAGIPPSDPVYNDVDVCLGGSSDPIDWLANVRDKV